MADFDAQREVDDKKTSEQVIGQKRNMKNHGQAIDQKRQKFCEGRNVSNNSFDFITYRNGKP